MEDKTTGPETKGTSLEEIIQQFKRASKATRNEFARVDSFGPGRSLVRTDYVIDFWERNAEVNSLSGTISPKIKFSMNTVHPFGKASYYFTDEDAKRAVDYVVGQISEVIYSGFEYTVWVHWAECPTYMDAGKWRNGERAKGSRKCGKLEDFHQRREDAMLTSQDACEGIFPGGLVVVLDSVVVDLSRPKGAHVGINSVNQSMSFEIHADLIRSVFPVRKDFGVKGGDSCDAA